METTKNASSLFALFAGDRSLIRRAALVLLLLPMAAAIASRAGAQTNPAVTVDFSAHVPNVRSVSGMASFPTPNNAPLSMIAPLQPKMWLIYAGVEGFAAVRKQIAPLPLRTIMVLGRADIAPPYDNWKGWERLVQRAAEATKGQKVIYLPWHAPNVQSSWKGTRDQYFELYLRTYKVIRHTLGADVPIAGPSISYYDKAFIKEFLDFCLAKGCEVNNLDWNELDDSVARIPAVALNLADARASFLSNPAYAQLKIREIILDGLAGRFMRHQPGGILASFYYAEKGGADGAVRGCWPDSAGKPECGYDALDGLIDRNSSQPRAGWWLEKTYADGVSTRVLSATTDPDIVAIASSASDAAGTAQVLLGHGLERGAARTAETVNVRLQGLDKLTFLANAATARLRLERIPDTDEVPLRQMIPAGEFDVPIQAGSARAILANVLPGDAYRIVISSTPPGSALLAAPQVTTASAPVGVPSRPAAIPLPPELRNGLVLYFNFDLQEAGGIVTDQSGAGNHGKVSGARWTAEGRRGGAYQFAPDGNFIVVPRTPSLSVKQVTLAAWIKTTRGDGEWRRIIENQYDHGFALSMGGIFQNRQFIGKVDWEVNCCKDGKAVLSDSAVNDGQWHHVVATYDGAMQKLYIDARLQQQIGLWNGLVGDNPWGVSIGGTLSQPGQTGITFDGTIDEAMMYSRALTDDEVRRLYEWASGTTASGTAIAPAAPGAELAAITVKSTPDGADITVDGKFLGNTPATLRLPAGEHTIKVSSEGFRNWERSLTVTPGGVSTLNATLQRIQ